MVGLAQTHQYGQELYALCVKPSLKPRVYYASQREFVSRCSELSPPRGGARFACFSNALSGHKILNSQYQRKPIIAVQVSPNVKFIIRNNHRPEKGLQLKMGESMTLTRSHRSEHEVADRVRFRHTWADSEQSLRGDSVISC